MRTNRGSRRTMVACLALALGSVSVTATAADVREFQWNVFLDNWQVLGPFPKTDQSDSGLDTKFLANEPQVEPGKPIQWQGKSYAWRPWSRQAVDFKVAFALEGDAGNYQVAYAWTQFTSPQAQPAMLALGHDESVRVWLNGEEVYRYDRGGSCRLDSSTAQVQLRRGTNTLLLKVGQSDGAWEAVARLRPASIERPLVVVRCKVPPPFSASLHTPTLQVDLLDAAGQGTSTWHTSGYRTLGPMSYTFALYAPAAQPVPARVRLRLASEAIAAVDQTVDWEQAIAGPIELDIRNAAPLTSRVVDAQTGKPIAGVLLQIGLGLAEERSGADGRFAIQRYHPMARAFWVAAAGYESRFVALPQPPQKEALVELTPGGQMVRGRIVDHNGKPVAGARISPGIPGHGHFAPKVTTDADGRFQIIGIPRDVTGLFAQVAHAGYGQRSFPLTLPGEGVTEVGWTLSPLIKHLVRLRLADTGRPPEKIEVHRGLKYGGHPVSWDADTSLAEAYQPSTGELELRVELPPIPTSVEMLYRFRARGYKDAVITVPKEAAARTFDLVLQRAAVVKGRVVAARTGQPVAGAVVAVVDEQDQVSLYPSGPAGPFQAVERFTGYKAETAADGSFELAGLDSSPKADLVILKSGAGFCYVPHARAMVQDGRLELSLPEPAKVQGRVLVAGKPVASERVQLTWQPLGLTRTGPQPLYFSASATTDAAGRFHFDGLGPGRYRLSRELSFKTGERNSIYRVGEEEVVLPPGQTVLHDLARPAGHTVKGQTLDKDGKPLGGCIVQISGSGIAGGRFDVAQSDNEGRFEIAHVPAGSFHFVAMHYTESSGRSDSSSSIMAKVDGPTEITIRLRPRSQAEHRTAPSLAGAVPPDVTLQFLDSDRTLALSEAFGKVVAIDFWATWCGPCMAIMPETKKTYAEYKDRDDVVFFTVSLDNDEEQLREVIKKEGLEFPVVFSGKGGLDPLARSFGVDAIPSSFVIGRDGRFAVDQVHGSQLAAAIKQALAKPLPPAFVGAKPARLTVKLTLDDQPMGLPGATVRFNAVDKKGKTVLEEKMPLAGVAPQICWIYPQLSSGGTVTVSVAAEGVEEQTQMVKDPSAKKMVEFAFTSPRSVSGRVAADEGKTAVPGMKVTVVSSAGTFTRSATTDAQGHFAIRVLPGVYSLMLEGTDDFAPVLDPAARTQVNVAEAADPEPLALAACRVVSISGVVKDADGKPVAGARVGSVAQRMPPGRTDAQGRFTLKGIPSEGPIQIGAIKEGKVGIVQRDGIKPGQTVEITLGQRPERQAGLARGRQPGQKAPELKAWGLADGTEVEWHPAEDTNTLVVFSALWHPEGRRFLRQAAVWAKKHSAHLAVFSIDWCRQQAQRELAAMDTPPQVLFAGPSDLGPAGAWHVTPPAQAFLVSPAGKLLPTPKP